MIGDIVLTILSEDGEQKVSISEYITKENLHAKIGLIEDPPADRRVVFMGTTIATFPFKYLDQHPKKLDVIEQMEEIVRVNPLKYFVPQADWALDFLNDHHTKLKILTAPNGVGKSVCGWIDVSLDLIENDPSWPIFKVCGVLPRPHRRRRMSAGVSIVSYQWENFISTIYPLIQRWTPLDALGEYRVGGALTPNWRSNPRCEINGIEVWMNACSQDQAVFESSARALYWWDEQGEEAKFNGANARVRRRGGRHIMTLTPHKVEGRPDTGGASFIKKYYTGEITSGLSVMFYQGDLKIPSYIFSEQEKRNTVKEWVEEPLKNNNLKKLREGQARVYGKFQESSGLVFDEWAKQIHVIDPFDIPKSWTRYRYIDWGRVEPTAALCVAVAPNGDTFAYQEYFESDLITSQNAIKIIEMCGNKRQREGGSFDPATGMARKRYTELFTSQAFRRTKMDSRSMNKKSDESVLTIGQIFRNAGIRIEPADGTTPYKLVPAAKEYLLLDMERKHYQTGELGAPSFYVFSSLVNFIREIENYVNEEIVRRARGTTFSSERPKQKDDHLMTCFLFMASDHPEYIEGWSEVHLHRDGPREQADQPVVDPFTGY